MDMFSFLLKIKNRKTKHDTFLYAKEKKIKRTLHKGQTETLIRL